MKQFNYCADYIYESWSWMFKMCWLIVSHKNHIHCRKSSVLGDCARLGSPWSARTSNSTGTGCKSTTSTKGKTCSSFLLLFPRRTRGIQAQKRTFAVPFITFCANHPFSGIFFGTSSVIFSFWLYSHAIAPTRGCDCVAGVLQRRSSDRRISEHLPTPMSAFAMTIAQANHLSSDAGSRCKLKMSLRCG